MGGPGEVYGGYPPFPPTPERRAQLELARQKLEEAIAKDRRNDEAWNLLGSYHVELRELPEARQALKKSLSLNPSGTGAMTNLALVLQLEGDYPTAEAQIRKALAVEPCSTVVNNELGLLLIKTKHLAEGKGAFLRAIRCDSLNVVAWHNLAIAQDLMGDRRAAVGSLRRAIAIKADASSYHSLGVVSLGLGNFEDATASFREAIRLQPTRYLYYQSLGRALVLVDPRLSLACLVKAEALKPDDGETARLLSELRKAGLLSSSFSESDLNRLLQEALQPSTSKEPAQLPANLQRLLQEVKQYTLLW